MKKNYEYVHYVCVSTTKNPTSLVVTLKNILNPKALSKQGHDNSLPKHRVTVLEDVHVELVHAHIHHLQAPQVPKCLHLAPVSSLPHLAELLHLDRGENLLGVFDLVHEHVHCCA